MKVEKHNNQDGRTIYSHITNFLYGDTSVFHKLKILFYSIRRN